MTDPHRRRWFQFRLQTFVVMVLLLGCLLGVFGPRIHRWWQSLKTPPADLPYVGVDTDIPSEGWDSPADGFYEAAETPLD